MKGFQEETLLDGELVWDEVRGEMVYYIFDGIMFMAKSLVDLDLNGRLRVVQNDVIGPLKARDSTTHHKDSSGNVYMQEFPFKMRMKQMWKPYGLRELFERVIPAQGHENDGLIFTPVKDAYRAGTCHRLLKWKPSEMNSIDFMLARGKSDGWQLNIATQGRVHYYCDFDLEGDVVLSKLHEDFDGRIGEFRFDGTSEKWRFMRWRPDKRLPNDSKTVEKVIHSIRDNVTKEQLLEREGRIRENWKAREKGPPSEVAVPFINLIPRSQQTNKPPPPFKYPIKLRRFENADLDIYDGWFEAEEKVEVETRVDDNDNSQSGSKKRVKQS